MRFGFFLDQHAEFDFYSASSLKQQSAGRHVVPLAHIILIPSHPIFFHSLMLRASRRSNKYQLYSPWFDPIGTRTRVLPHSRRACKPLCHRYGLCLMGKKSWTTHLNYPVVLWTPVCHKKMHIWWRESLQVLIDCWS